jgi:hypothetical protein
MDNLKPKKVATKIKKTRRSAFERFPLAFTLLGTFGVVATFYGFEGIIDSTFLNEHPFVLLCVGLLTLVATGSLYRKLD